MKMHCKNAYSIARFLSQHPYIDKVIYTGLENHPGNKIAKKQMKGYGGIISFYIKGGKDETNNFIKNL